MKKAAVIVIVLLALLGSFSAITRATVVISVLRGAPANELSSEDSANLKWLAGAIGVDASSQRYRELEEDTQYAAAKFNALPYATLLHVLPGMVFLLLAPMQFVPRFRSRSRVHRTMGYVLLTAALPFGITGLFFSFRDPVFGIVGASASALGGTWFLYSGVRAYAAIRRRDIDNHRAWMLRALAMAYAIAVIRAIDLMALSLLTLRPRVLGGPSFWVGFLLSAFAAEWWIHRTAKQQARALTWAR